MRIILFCLLLCLSACSGKKNQEDILRMRGTFCPAHLEVVKVDNKSVIHADYSEYIDPQSVEVIPLETTDEALIAMAHKIEIREGKIYVFDRQQHAVFVFSDKGKFLGKVDKFGRGPDEYALVCDFCVDDEWVGMLNFDRLLFYHPDLPDSVRIVTLDTLGASGLQMYSDEQHFYFRPSNIRTIHGSVIVCDKKGKMTSVLAEPKYASLVALDFPPFFIPMEEKLYYYQMYNDTIYQITDTALISSLVFDGGQHNTDEEIQNFIWKRQSLPGDGMFAFHHLHYADSVLSFFVNDHQTQYQGYYSLRTQKAILISMDERQDDIFHLKLKWYPEVATPEGYFYGIIYPVQFSWLGVKPGPGSPFAGVDENNNPYLVKYKLKKF